MEQTNDRINFWRDMYKAAAQVEKPLIATLGRLITAVGTSNLPPDLTTADIDALANFTAFKFALITPKNIATLETRFMQKICPPNCYNPDGVITAATGKHCRYVDIRQQTSAPIEIKTAATGDCKKCTYAKARGTAYDTCAKCQKLGTYFEWTKANLHTIPGSTVIYHLGLSPYEEILKIGYDPATMEIILPLSSQKYVSIELDRWKVKDEEKAETILAHYNLQPRRNGETTLDGRCNYDTPYLDNRFVGTDGEIIFAGCIGLVYRRIKLPFPPTEEVQILQPYKI